MASHYRIQNIEYALATVLFIAVTSIALGYLARFVARLRGLSPAEQRKVFWGFTLAGPWIVGFIIFVAGPAAASFYYSFTNYHIGKEMHFVGLDNYRKMLLVEGAGGRQFNKAMLNSFYYALLGVPLQVGAALIMAMLLNNELPGIRVFRMIFYLPVILAGGPALLLAWRYMLSSNGGFINIALQRFAHSFVLFDYLYRAFIYLVEGFNGFYTGIARMDPIGPLKYTFPALLGVLVLVSMLGEWGEGKRVRAWRVSQLVGLLVFYRLAYQGLVAEPVSPSWAYLWALALTVGIAAAAWLGNRQALRLWQWGGLLGTLLWLGLTLRWANGSIGGRALPYLGPLALAGVESAASFVGPWRRSKYVLLIGVAVVLGVMLFARVVPGQLDSGRLQVIPKYLTFHSTLEHPNDENYLKKVYPVATMSSLWLYGLVAVVTLALAVHNERNPRAHRAVLYGALTFFVLFALGSFLDGRAYFRAFERIAEQGGHPNYHFALFHQATDQLPDSDRVPLWMSSELWTKPSLILITMWSSGAGMLIFLAALKGVPRAIYEAAEVDGANTIQRFLKITLPLISPATFYNIVIGVIAALQTFDTVYILQTPSTQDSISSVAYFLYIRTFRQLNIGEGAAMSWILVVIILTLTTLQFRYSKSWVHYES